MKLPACDCKQATHHHGTRIMYLRHRCRCNPCRDETLRYERQVTRNRAYGRSNYATTDRARSHIEYLQQNGLSLKQISKKTGVPASSLGRIIYGRKERGEGPAKRILKTNEAKILALHPSLDVLADGKRIDATGTRRRLQALCTLGWSQAKLSTRSGVGELRISQVINGAPEVHVATARKINALYDQLWDQHAPRGSQSEKIAYASTTRRAREKGWAPPLAWDEHTIDNPRKKPQGLVKA